MRTLTFRGVLSWLLIMLMGTPSFAADSAAAMLYTNGTAWINGGTIPKSSAIFSGDLVETKSDSVANIKSSGTSVLVLSDSFIQYQGSAVKLEHGSMNVATSKGMAAQVGGLKVVPAAASWTEPQRRCEADRCQWNLHVGGGPGNHARRDHGEG